MRLKRWVCLGVISVLLSGQSWAEAPLTLQAQVERSAETRGGMLQGQVVDGATGAPLSGVQVTLPDSGFRMSTDSGGQYQVPHPQGRQPLIMSLEKPGYAPLSVTIRENAPPRFTIRLEKQHQMLVLDTRLHHLGDDGYSPLSASAMQFRKSADGPILRVPFMLNGVSLGVAPSLQIGSIIGLDTAMAHFLSDNPMPVSAGPLLIKLNGRVIARIQVNGDNQRVQVPRQLLNTNGQNLLEIEAGGHYPEPGRLDYDDMELIHLVLHYQ